MSKFDDFLNDVRARGGVDVDGAYGKQCMDLYNYFSQYMVGATGVGAGYAKDLLNNQKVYEYYDRIDNYPEFVPQKGDVAVWQGGSYGHTAICLGEGDTNRFKTIDQNWKPLQLSEEWHNYIYMAPLTFLRLKDQSGFVDVPTQVEERKSIDEIAREVLAGKWGNGEERRQALETAGYDYDSVQSRVTEIYYGDSDNNNPDIKVGDKVRVIKAVQYNGSPFKVYYDTYDVIEVVGERVVIGIGNTVTCAINKNNLQKV